MSKNEEAVELTELEKDELRLKVKQEHLDRLSKQLAQYIDNEGPILDKRQAFEALSVRDELNEEISVLKRKLKENEVFD